MAVLSCPSVGWGGFLSCWNLKPVTCISVVFLVHAWVYTSDIQSSVSLQRADASWVRKRGTNEARGVITAGTLLLPLVNVCLASFILSSITFVFSFSVHFTTSAYFSSVETLKSRQRIMSRGNNNITDPQLISLEQKQLPLKRKDDYQVYIFIIA